MSTNIVKVLIEMDRSRRIIWAFGEACKALETQPPSDNELQALADIIAEIAGEISNPDQLRDEALKRLKSNKL
jgi:hypothetical protein